MTAQLLSADEQLLDGYLLVGSERMRASSGGIHEHVSQISGRVQATVPLAGAAEIDAAVACARDAGDGWRATPGEQRRDLLLRLAELIERDPVAAELTAMGALESGLPVRLGGGVATIAAWLRYYAGWADKVHGELVRTPPSSPTLDYTIPEPYGVVAMIVPWNFPLSNLGMKIPAALTAGNTVVLKPAELAPFVALRLGELALEAGIPPGVLNVVPGGPEGGAALVSHPGVDKISFTGSGATASVIMRAAAESLTPLCLELGGKSANLVFDDADLDRAVPAAVSGVLNLAGQGCVAPTRLLVQRAVYEEVCARVVDAARAVVVGNPLDPRTTMGPVISRAACERILGVVRDAAARGDGTLALGGERCGGDLADGFYVEPTVFRDVDNASPLAQEEVFGPVLAIVPFDTEAEGIALANATRFGLGGYLHTRDLARAHRVASALVAGVVAVNGSPTSTPATPFGGSKDSGFGREGGRAGLEEFLRVKNVNIAV